MAHRPGSAKTLEVYVHVALPAVSTGRALPKKVRPGFGGSLAAREPVWDGEGWGCDRVAGS